MVISFQNFVQTGLIHGIGLGHTEAQVIQVLGEPEAKSLSRKSSEMAVFKYGRLQVFFFTGQVELLFFEVTGSRGPFHFAEDSLLRPLSLYELEQQLFVMNMDWFEEKNPFNHQPELFLKSGVGAVFSDNHLYRWQTGLHEHKRVHLYQQLYRLF